MKELFKLALDIEALEKTALSDFNHPKVLRVLDEVGVINPFRIKGHKFLLGWDRTENALVLESENSFTHDEAVKIIRDLA